MAELRTVDHNVIYINPQPHRVSEYVAMPYLAALRDDSLVCICRHGTARESMDGVVKVHRSTDGGAAWVCAGAIFESTCDTQGAQWPAGIAVLPDGEIVVMVNVCHRLEEGGKLFLARSQDGGVSWSVPELVQVAPYGRVGTIGRITGLVNGTLIGTGEARGDGDLIPVDSFANLISRSRDGGRTWDPVQPANVSANPFYFDLAIAQLVDERLLAAYWTHDVHTDNGINVHTACSSDLGRTWTPPRDCGIWGQRTEIVTLQSGRVLAVTNHRRSPLGIRAVLSQPDGMTFDERDHTEIWGIAPANIRTAPPLAAQQDSEQDALHAWHHFTFGTPTAVQLSDGVVVIAFYVTESSVTYVRCCRMIEAS